MPEEDYGKYTDDSGRGTVAAAPVVEEPTITETPQESADYDASGSSAIIYAPGVDTDSQTAPGPGGN